MIKKPNFFIVGAPKCGTTALSEYLKEHPNIFMSTPKEPHYFAANMVFHREIENADDYLNLFRDATDENIAIGEASVWYLYSKKAIENIHLFDEKAKIIVMLRKPVDMVYSMHAQQVYSLGEDVVDFEKAWDLEDERKRGNSIPKHILHVPNLYYSEIAKYHTQLSHLYKYFPREQVKVIIFDDFKKNAEIVFKDVLNFLELPNFEKKSFQNVNVNTRVRFSFLKMVLKNESSLGKSTRIKIKQFFGIKRIGFRSFLSNINTIEEERKVLHPIVKRRIINHYSDEVSSLSILIGRDLKHWNK